MFRLLSFVAVAVLLLSWCAAQDRTRRNLTRHTLIE